jgi:transcriptional regulator with XRE-family HTH domain
METMGDRIKQARGLKGLSLEKLGELCGVGRAAVHKWENGDTKNMRNETLLLLAQALGTDPAYLVWGPDRRPLQSAPLRRDSEEIPPSNSIRISKKR